MRYTRWLAATVGLTMLAGLSPAAGAAGAADPSPAGKPGTAAGPSPAGRTGPDAGAGATVTLLTGDVVELLSAEKMNVRPGAGRERVTFLTQEHDGHRYVIPSDAAGLIAAGRLDRRLFDLTTLTALGYDDARSQRLPLIVRAEPSSGTARTRAWAAAQRVDVTGEVPAVGAVAVQATKKDAGRWWSALTKGRTSPTFAGGIRSVWLDGKRQVSLDRSTAQIGAPAMWRAGFTGKGVKVAVLDTGIDAGHPDFAGRIVANHNFTEVPEAGDVIGHGTHVASTIAGSGAASGGRYQGVAPDASLLVGKVCEDRGCSDSAILAGMQWAAEQGADVVNMSLGAPDTPGTDLIEEAVNQLSTRYGTLFVVAAGNDGAAGPGSVSSPATADAALAVGASTRYENVAAFSSRGPRVDDGASKPEIVAPGVDIVAARSSTAPVPPVDEQTPAYTAMSGTSMATPHVAGAAALLAQRRPDWSGARLKAAMVSTATSFTDVDRDAQGAGQLDLAALLGRSVLPDTGSLDLGLQSWPHGDDQPVSRQVTYHNDGTAPVTLDLRATLTGPGGVVPPTSMLAVSPSRITVPAGGTAAVTVTVDTRVKTPDGRYAGQLVANSGGTSGGGASARTLLSVMREAEHHDLKLRVLDRDGAAAQAYLGLATSWSTDVSTPAWEPGGQVLRLPVDDYTIGAQIVTAEGTDAETWTLLALPKLRLTGDTEVVLDARAGKPITVGVPEPTAEFAQASTGYRLAAVGSGLDTTLSVSNLNRGPDNIYIAQLGAVAPGERFRSDVSARWLRRSSDGRFLNSPYSYNAIWPRMGGVPNGFAARLRAEDFATVRTRFNGPQGHYGNDGAQSTGSSASFVYVTGQTTLPAKRTDYYYAPAEIPWFQVFTETATYPSGPSLNAVSSKDHGYRAGQMYQEEWNGAVFGPGFGHQNPRSPQGVVRSPNDELQVNLSAVVDPVPGRSGLPKYRTDSGRLRLYRDGQLVAENPATPGSLTNDLPRAAATYRLEQEVDRHSYSPVTQRVSVAWTFRSAHVAAPLPVSVMAVHFAPALDEAYRAPAGQPYRIPVRVEHHNPADGATVTRLTVDVSYDDGKTWQPATVTGTGDNRAATVTHPAGAGHVSLRATATDSLGGKVEQTILRAYLLRG
ncbi:S8 family serine peptidase [Micromonospora sp. NPDC049559]|uniref:S8 family serine peptidase n=1 Tax=Micromonospora sp. NPDC049559 TaxID=3155923 RepID=UPI00341B45C2